MFTNAISKVSKSIFPLFHFGPGGYGVLGTGFFIDDSGHFLTAAHVIKALPKGQKLAYLGNIPHSNFARKTTIEIEIVKIDEAMDLALGKVYSEALAPLVLAEADALLGQSISLCGYPLPHIQRRPPPQGGNAKQITLDVSSVRQYWQPTIKMDHFKANFMINKKFDSFITQHAALPGMSGGPVFDLEANVVGLTSAVWPRKVALNQGRHIDVQNGIGVELHEVKSFLNSTIVNS